jgi:RHS repeat-associated protein
MKTLLKSAARRLTRVERPFLRILSTSLAVWMAAMPSVALAARLQAPSTTKLREAKRVAAVAKMRAETGADPKKLAALHEKAAAIEETHLSSRLGGLSRAETELRTAVDQLTTLSLTADERADALHRLRAQGAVIKAGAQKLEQIQKASHHLSGLSKTVKLAKKLAQQIAPLGPGLKGGAAAQTATLTALHKQLSSIRPPTAHPAAPPLPQLRLTTVTPRQQQASRADTRRMHPLFASISNWFHVPTTVSELDEGALLPPGPADLLPTPEAPLTPAITALATQLGTPLAIYEYVRNQIEPEPYFGSKKGAVGTLLEGSGNDADQASLLVALLRASGVNARYEVGQVLLSPRQAMDFTNTNDPFAAVTVMNTIGIPATANVGSAGEIDSVSWDQHVWVRAYVPYTNYRGVSAPGSESVWIRLDPSIKQVSRQPPAFAVGQNVLFDFNGYLNGTTPMSTVYSPLQIFEGQLAAYLQANQLSCDSLDKLRPTNAVIPVNLRLLPSELGVQLQQSESVGDALDPATDYTFTVQVDNGIAPVQTLPATYGQNYALRYVGATAADKAAIVAAGSVQTVSPVAVSLQPSLVVNGVNVWQGATVTPGVAQTLIVTVNVPGLPQAVAPHNIVAGGIYALGLATGHPTDAQLAQAKDQIPVLVTAGASADDVDAARAQALALTYLHHIDRDERKLFGYAQSVGVKDVTEILAGHTALGASFLGTPVSESAGPWRVDVGREANTPFAQNNDNSHILAINEIAGFQGSHWENRLFQEVFNTAGVSTTNGLQLAVAGGGKLLTLNAAGGTSQLTGYSAGSTAEMEGALSLGQLVTAPSTPFTTGHFHNVEAYLLLDPVAGTGVFREGSTFNGGENNGPGNIASDGSGCPCRDGSNHQTHSFVNLTNGNYVFTRTDLTLPAAGIPIVFKRSYDSGSGVAGVLGANWWHNYERKLVSNADASVTYVTGEGQLIQSLLFTVNGAAFNSPPGWNLALAAAPGGGWTLTYKNGWSSTYDNNGLLASDQDLNKNAVTIQRNADHTINTVTDAAGRIALTFAYAGGLLQSVTDAANRAVTFGQTGTDLTSAKDVLGQTERYAYDASHRLVGNTDKNANLWSVAYDANGRWDQEVDPVGNAMSASYDNTGLSTVFTDRRGFSSLTTYNGNGNPVSVTDPSGNTKTTTWDANMNKLSETDGRGNATTYLYDNNGNMTQKKAPDQGVTSSTYVNNLPTLVTTNDTSTTNGYDANGNLQTSQDRYGNVTNYTYFGSGQLKSVTAPGNANPTTYAYNADGTVQQVTDPNNAVTKFGYDAAGHLNAVTDPGNHTRTMNRDAAGHELWTKDATPAQNQTTFTYDNEGNRQTAKDPTGALTTLTYDSLNRLTAVTDASSHLSTGTYDPEGLLTTATDANGNTVRFAYDESGRPLSVTDALGNTISLGFCADLNSKPCQEVDASGNVTKRSFDPVGRVTSVSDALGNSTLTMYDGDGQVTSVTDPRGNKTIRSYDAAGRLGTVTTPSASLTYAYDGRGNRASIQESRLTTFTYDATNRLLTETNPLNQTWTYTYNPDGTRATKLDPNNNLTKYAYDEDKRLTNVTFADTTQLTFGYDSRGHRNSEVSPDLNRTMTYDPLGRLQTVTDNTLNKTLTYGYDAAGNRTSLTYDGLTTTYTYDANRRLVQLVDPDGEATGFAYNPAGRRTTLVQGNGISTSYLYDATNRPTSITSPVQTFNYTYDVAGNPTSKTFADGSSESYLYDSANEITGVTTPQLAATYTYINGDRTGLGSTPFANPSLASAQASQFNFFHQVNTVFANLSGVRHTWTYTYDNNGNRSGFSDQDTTTQPPPALLNTTYTWNDDDRLTKITFPSGATNTFQYDANGTRVGKSDSQGSVRYLIDPQNRSIVAAYDANTKARLAVYNQNPQMIDEVVSFKATTGKYYPHTDMLGSVYSATDSNGKVQATWTYDVYGARAQASGTLTYPYGFSGREHDTDSGLIYMRDRYMEPSLGEWLQADRIISAKYGTDTAGNLADKWPTVAWHFSARVSTEVGNRNSVVNAYTYTTTPTRFVDPTGQSACPVYWTAIPAGFAQFNYGVGSFGVFGGFYFSVDAGAEVGKPGVLIFALEVYGGVGGGAAWEGEAARFINPLYIDERFGGEWGAGAGYEYSPKLHTVDDFRGNELTPEVEISILALTFVFTHYGKYLLISPFTDNIFSIAGNVSPSFSLAWDVGASHPVPQ